MPTQNVNLTDRQVEFIRRAVETGDYNSASEVVRDALRLLKAYKEEQQARLAQLRTELNRGSEAYARGDFTELNGADEIAGYFEDVKKRGMEKLAGETNAPFPSAD